VGEGESHIAKERVIWRGNEVPVVKREKTRVVILTPCLIYLQVHKRELSPVAYASKRAKKDSRKF
jgi:hypothetical protein